MKQNIFFILSVCVLSLMVTNVTFGQTWQTANSVNRESENKKLFTRYRDYADVPSIKTPTPSIVELNLIPEQLRLSDFGVYDVTSKTFIPYRFIPSSQKVYKTLSVQNRDSGEFIPSLSDKNIWTDYQFGVSSNTGRWGQVNVYLSYDTEVVSDSLTLSLSDYVELPLSITLQALVGEKWVTVLNNVTPQSSTVNFPKTTSGFWLLSMSHNQPLRIQELTLNDLSAQTPKAAIRFLALPNHAYQIFANPESEVSDYTNTIESPNLTNSTALISGGTVSFIQNSLFIPVDSDGDGVADFKDNCVSVVNPGQLDVNKNNIGDECDDFDGDNVIQSIDNCPSVPNTNQYDTDGDKIGDACDPDESRITERYPWIVWLGLGFATLVFVVLLLMVAHKARQNAENILSQ